jgi:DnaJ-domain-containing protein 1
MSIIILLAGVLLVLLVWVGRKPARVTGLPRLWRALIAAMAAVAAVVSALRGGWIPSLILVGLSAWLAQTARPARTSSNAAERGMSLREAREILGVEESAGRSEIDAAYRRLMRRAHPDHGGSTGLASQLNAARDRLLGRRGRLFSL